MKKHSIAVKVLLILSVSLAVAIAYGAHRSYDDRAHRAACYRANLESLNSLEASTSAINTQLQNIQLDQDMIDKLDGTDDENAVQRRSHMIEGVKLKLTKVNQDRAEGQRRAEQVQAELSICLAKVK